MENELNEKLHEAMGNCVHDWREHHGSAGLRLHCRKCDGWSEMRVYNVPDYCNDIAACLGPGGLVEWMRGRGATFEISCEANHEWFVSIRPFKFMADTYHESLSMAISLAAIEVLADESLQATTEGKDALA